MRYLHIISIILLCGCAAATRRSEPGPIGFTREVTGIGLYNTDLPARYRRLSDSPGGRVYVLWSQQQLCVVSEDQWFHTSIGDHVPCEWRLPR